MDLGIKTTVATSDGESSRRVSFIDRSRCRSLSRSAAGTSGKRSACTARRRGGARRPSTGFEEIVDRYQMIVVGDVSAPKLAKTRMAKSVLDAGGACSKRAAVQG